MRAGKRDGLNRNLYAQQMVDGLFSGQLFDKMPLNEVVREGIAGDWFKERNIPRPNGPSKLGWREEFAKRRDKERFDEEARARNASNETQTISMAEPVQYPLTAHVADKSTAYSSFLSQVPPVLMPDLAVEQRLNFRSRFAFDKRRRNETAQLIEKFEGQYEYTEEDGEDDEGMLRVESGTFTLHFTQAVNLLELNLFRPAGDALHDRIGRLRKRKRKQRH